MTTNLGIGRTAAAAGEFVTTTWGVIGSLLVGSPFSQVTNTTYIICTYGRMHMGYCNNLRNYVLLSP